MAVQKFLHSPLSKIKTDILASQIAATKSSTTFSNVVAMSGAKPRLAGWINPNRPDGAPDNFPEKTPQPSPRVSPTPFTSATPQPRRLPKKWIESDWLSAFQPSPRAQTFLTYAAAGLGAVVLAVGVGKAAKALGLKNVAKLVLENPGFEKRAIEELTVTNAEKVPSFFQRAKNWFSDWKLGYGQKMNRLFNIDGGSGGLSSDIALFNSTSGLATVEKQSARKLNLLAVDEGGIGSNKLIDKTNFVAPVKVTQVPYVQDNLLSTAEQKNKALILHVDDEPLRWVKRHNTSSYNPFELYRRFQDRRMLSPNYVLKGPLGEYAGSGFAQFDKWQLREIRRLSDYANKEIKTGSKNLGKKLWSAIDTIYHRKSEFPPFEIYANSIVNFEKFRGRQQAYNGLNYFEIKNLYEKNLSARKKLRSVIFKHLDVGQSIIGLVVTGKTKPAKAKAYDLMIEGLQQEYDTLASRYINSKIKTAPVAVIEKTAIETAETTETLAKEKILRVTKSEPQLVTLEPVTPEPFKVAVEPVKPVVADPPVIHAETKLPIQETPSKPRKTADSKIKSETLSVESSETAIKDAETHFTSLNPTGIKPGSKRRNVVKNLRGTSFTDEYGNRFIKTKQGTIFLRKVETDTPNAVRSSRSAHRISWEMFEDAAPEKNVAARRAWRTKDYV